MKAFRQNFTTPTVNEWLQKVEKDLKGKSFDELSWAWSEDLSFPPIHYTSPTQDGFAVPANKNAWIIGDFFDAKVLKQTNSKILDALNMGTEGIHIHIHSLLALADWQTLLDQVILTYITLTISFEEGSQDSIAALDTFLQDSDWDPKKLILHLDKNTATPTYLKACKSRCAHFAITPNSTAKQFAQQLQQAEQLLSKHPAQQIFFAVNLSSSFYHNIIFLQSLKILWQNILDANQLDPHTHLYVVAKSTSEENMDENTQKINASVQAVSAVVAGVQYLEIHSHDSNDAAFDRRINRNIQHLLKLESYMDQVMNPTEGSYYFDQLTKELTEATWSNFQELT